MGWFYLFVTIGFAIFLYWLRQQHRLWYGVSEILVALLIIALVFVPPRGWDFMRTASPASFWFLPLTKTVGIFAGVYAFVRGLDNIDAGLPSSTWRERWEWVKQSARRVLDIQ
jgi:hypothetical protein